MSELDEFGIARYTIDTGDKVTSILLNDIAEDDDNVFLKLKCNYLPLDSYLNSPLISEWIEIRGKRYISDSWSLGDYIYVMVDKWYTKHGRTLSLDTNVSDNVYDLEWLLANKVLSGPDGGWIKRNYRDICNVRITFYDFNTMFRIDHSKIKDFYEFEKTIANELNRRISKSSQKKQGS